MIHKVTIKDVAREAGVSVATVSYVVNNRTDMRISEKTRKKVLQVINLLNYTPNQSAQALATSRNRMVALYLAPETSVLKRAEQMYLIDFLSTALHEKGYDLIYLNQSYTEKYDNADAIIGYDISSPYFHQIGDSNFSPLLALDCFINDPLFFQVNSDYEHIAAEADAYFHHKEYTLLLLDTPNDEKKDFVANYFKHICYIHTVNDLCGFHNQNVVVTDQTIMELLGGHSNLFFAPAISPRKVSRLFECIDCALLRTPLTQHTILV